MAILSFLGRLHPLIVHLPIGFLLLAAVFYFFGNKEKHAFLQKALPITLFLSAISSVAAALFGWFLANEGSYDDQTLFLHRWMGIGVAVLATTAWILTIQSKKIPVWLIGAMVILLTVTGHLGGALTHGADYLIQPFKGEIKKEERTFPARPDSIIAYTHLVQPILEEKCYSCHNDTKQNGGLNLSTWEGLQKGGDGGKVLKNEAWESELFHRVTLPQSSKKFMPPKGEPLTFGEITILKWWMQQGAKREVSIVEMDTNEEIKQTLLHDYQLDITPKSFVEIFEIEALDNAILSELDEAGWQLSELAQTNNLLDVGVKAGSERPNISDLIKASQHVTWLNLEDSELTNEDLKTIAQLPNLSRLRLQNNPISDEGLAHLTSLKNLESLNLYGTAITDAGLEYLKQMPALKRVYLWQTQVTEEGKKALLQAREDLELP